MREVFRSPRLENVEGAAELLKQANIEATVWNGRSYKGGRRRGFSYRDPVDSATVPQLWVVHNGDLPEARRLLREAGLLEPSQRDSFLNEELRFATRAPEKTPWLTPQNLRTALLIGIVAIVGAMTWIRVKYGL
jgi:hypothetical protein